MNQYTLELMYDPLYFLVLLIGINIVFKIYKQSFIRQTIYYSIIGILFIISIIIIKLRKSELEKEKIHYTKVSQILTVVIIITTITFIYYMLN